MKIIPRSQFEGSAEELQARVAAFRQAVTDHKLTVGEPAPREIGLIEALAFGEEDFDLEPAPLPPAPLTPEELQEQARRLIDADRDVALATGAVSWNGKNWHIDNVFQVHLSGFITAFNAGILPPGANVSVRTADNQTAQLSLSDLKQLAGAVLQKVQAVWAASWVAKDTLP